SAARSSGRRWPPAGWGGACRRARRSSTAAARRGRQCSEVTRVQTASSRPARSPAAAGRPRPRWWRRRCRPARRRTPRSTRWVELREPALQPRACMTNAVRAHTIRRRGRAIYSWRDVGAAVAAQLQRCQEGQDVALRAGGRVVEVGPDGRRLTAVTRYRVGNGQAHAVVHHAVAHAEAPQRRRADLVAGRLATILRHAIAGPDVVVQEVAERMDEVVAQRLRDGERALVDHGSGGRGGDGAHVADRAPDLDERGLAAYFGRTDRSARWRLGRAHEFGERCDVGTERVIGIHWIFRIRYGVERGDRSSVRGVLVGL